MHKIWNLIVDMHDISFFIYSEIFYSIYIFFHKTPWAQKHEFWFGGGWGGRGAEGANSNENFSINNYILETGQCIIVQPIRNIYLILKFRLFGRNKNTYNIFVTKKITAWFNL